MSMQVSAALAPRGQAEAADARLLAQTHQVPLPVPKLPNPCQRRVLAVLAVAVGISPSALHSLTFASCRRRREKSGEAVSTCACAFCSHAPNTDYPLLRSHGSCVPPRQAVRLALAKGLSQDLPFESR